MTKYTVVYEKIDDPEFETGYYYAHVPSLGLTTHGKGIEGAKTAIIDLVKLWIEDIEVSNNETEYFVSTIEVS